MLQNREMNRGNCWEVGDLDWEESKSMLALSMSRGIGPATFQKLMEAFGSAEGVFAASAAEITGVCPQLKDDAINAILSGPNLRTVRHQEESCQRLGVRIVSYRSSAYPGPLLTLPHPLPFIFMQGEWHDSDQKAVAIVGTRYPSGYGSRMARDLTLGLIESGFTIVSGLARGIDTVSHEAALSGDGRTLAVLGSGLDWIYPSENLELSRRIANKGCLISEFPMGMAPHATHFPRRNRLISALSMGTVVVEAGNDSGALITADFALEQGREVFAVPGSVDNPGARGPHKLIQQGAHLAERSEDIIRVLQGLSQAIPARRISVESVSAKQKLKKFPIINDREVGTEIPSEKFGFTLGLDLETREILSILGQRALTLDDIAQMAVTKPVLKHAPPHRLLSGLLELELKGVVRRLPGALFKRVEP